MGAKRAGSTTVEKGFGVALRPHRSVCLREQFSLGRWIIDALGLSYCTDSVAAALKQVFVSLSCLTCFLSFCPSSSLIRRLPVAPCGLTLNCGAPLQSRAAARYRTHSQRELSLKHPQHTSYLTLSTYMLIYTHSHTHPSEGVELGGDY